MSEDWPTCGVDGCETATKYRTTAYCSKHTERIRRHGNPHTVAYIEDDHVARFWSKVNKTETCWLWTGVVLGTGYGQFSVKYQRWLAHRYAYTLLVGPIPEGLTIDHVKARGCTNRNCVNPAHLEPVTMAENQRRSDSPTAKQGRMERCVEGHEFTMLPNGHRRCLVCKEAWRKRRVA